MDMKVSISGYEWILVDIQWMSIDTHRYWINPIHLMLNTPNFGPSHSVVDRALHPPSVFKD